MDRHFRGLIWTNHALAKLKERGISQADAWATWKRPDNSRYAQSKQAWIYYRVIRNQKIEVVAKKNEYNQWLILSVWSKTIKKPKSSSVSSKFLKKNNRWLKSQFK